MKVLLGIVVLVCLLFSPNNLQADPYFIHVRNGRRYYRLEFYANPAPIAQFYPYCPTCPPPIVAIPISPIGTPSGAYLQWDAILGRYVPVTVTPVGMWYNGVWYAVR